MQPVDEHGIHVFSRTSQQERNISVFGHYLRAMCAYLQINQVQLANQAGLSKKVITRFTGPSSGVDNYPAPETLKSLVAAIESIAATKGRFLPCGWHLEFLLSPQAEKADGLLYLSYFRKQTMLEEDLKRAEALIFSMQETIDIVRRRSRSDK